MRGSALLTVMLALGACATGARAQGVSLGSPEGGPDTSSSDAGESDAGTAAALAGAEADYQRAVNEHRQGNLDAAKGLAQALRDHGSGSVRPRATALLALVLLEQGDAAGARAVLGPGTQADAVTNFLAGVAEARLGDPAAWQRLAPFADDPAGLTVPGLDAARTAMMGNVALAEAAAAAGQVQATLAAWQRYADRAAPHERAFALHRAEAVVSRVSVDEALALWRDTDGMVARAALGPKAAVALASQGRADEAKRASEEAGELRKRLDAVASSAGSAWAGTGDPGRLGLSVPLSGRGQQLGLALTRGAVVAIGAPAAAQDVAPVQVMVRDTTGRGGPLTAATELAREEAVLGIVGMADPATVDQMSRDGVPYLVLGGANPGAQTSAFQLVHDTDARARALAQAARSRGVRTFSILAPETAAAGRTAEAFRQAIGALGGLVVAEVKYPAGATSFTREVEVLKKQRWEALFVPDTADKLELIAPALAVADLWPQPAAQVVAAVSEKPKRGTTPARRNVLLLSTAPGASKRLLDRAGRYVQGALVAPGFHADPQQATAARFVSDFRTLYGRDPGASDAFGFDGVHLLRACVDRGARSRADVLRLLSSGAEFPGVTGKIRFGPDHGRVDPAPVYEVRGDALRASLP
ncbi:MAG: penicillin-binding protein activator [Myxococcales bacterium]|nr:penicillin-binding protein activator [Myxococcales bacterium]